ncbi:hypothetical protein H6P81_006241 [Aristolochia fimbriata]|uniref:Uncharacterized protein n=1 Tax=Aristolochia fimbriata TaxID=158543 RepID=A0AAV7EWX1_ARIFI|nr:hypothetical protein H6P81_006241 [Aristolochia fimbriata]
MERWNRVYDLLNQNNVKVTFGLNALAGRKKMDDEGNALWGGVWDFTNARDFINYTISRGATPRFLGTGQ